MAGSVERRVIRLEGLPGFGGGWRAWVGRPFDQWPDVALEGFLRATVAPEEVPERLRADLVPGAVLSDTLLLHIAEQGEHRA